MKKTITLLTLIALSTLAWAKPVDLATAKRVAQAVLHKEVVDATPVFLTQCHLLVGADGTGFALVAADDCVRPLLAYSPTGLFPTDTLPAHVADWLAGYEIDIALNKEAGVEASEQVQRQWQALTSDSPKWHKPRNRAVGPLVQTTWNQSPFYNNLCPADEHTGTHAVTGCVATATAQIMRYWSHPAVGRGSNSYYLSEFGSLTANFDTTHYAWDLMPNTITPHTSQEEINAIATLMLHVGVAVEMQYGIHGSSAFVSTPVHQTASSENALRYNFRYKHTLFSASKEDYTDQEWDDLMTAEIDSLRPVLFSGSDGEGGHAFILDGYDSLGLFHFNWGWGGHYDGFYTLDSMSPGSSGIGGNSSSTYNIGVKALLGIMPADDSPAQMTLNVASANPTMGSVSGSGTYRTYSDQATLLATATEGYRFSHWGNGSRNNPVKLAPNSNYTDTAFFEPLQGDTLAYCYGAPISLWGENRTPLEWAIRLPKSAIGDHRQLEEVQIYSYVEHYFTVKIYNDRFIVLQ